MQTETGAIRTMNMRVGPVRNALASIADICDKGHTVVFDNDGSYILEKATGETIPMHRKGKTYKFKVKVLRPGTKAKAGVGSAAVSPSNPSQTKAKALAPLADSPDPAPSAGQDFHRQAH